MGTFSWSILSPSPSGPTASGPSPLAVSTEIDLDAGGPDTIIVHWGDGKSSTINFADGEFDKTVGHTYVTPGLYRATSDGGNPGTLTFTALGLAMKPKVKRVSFARK
jgi:hypothetical protein